ncbi:MAG: ATP-binding protein [Thermoflexales bacterium]|nr:ATP-binding protein [Thermoflexales bacterium]
MNQEDRLQIRIKGTLEQVDVHALLACCLQAMLARVDGLAQADAVAAEALAAAQQPLVQAIVQEAGTSEISATLQLSNEPRRFSLKLPGGWCYEALLPETTTRPTPPEAGAGPINLGVGLFLVRSLMDEVVYIPRPRGNRWRLVKVLPFSAIGCVKEDERPITLTVDLPASYRYLNVLGEGVAALLGHASVPSTHNLTNQIQLAVQEVCTNIIEHALNGSGQLQVTLTLDRAKRRFIVETWDAGTRTFDPSMLPNRFEFASPGSSHGSGLLRGGAVLFISATLVNAGNYLFNLIMGRWLGPSAFADLSLIVTLFLVTSFLTTSVQTPAARFSAVFAAARDLSSIARLRRFSLRLALWIGLGLMVIFALGAPLWTSFFSVSSPVPFILFGLFAPFFLMQGVERGLLQGRMRFGLLAATYQVEMWSRLLLSLAFVALGFGVNGAVAGITLSFVTTWLTARRVAADLPTAQPITSALRREVMVFTGPALAAQLGQILINNSDVLIVRRFFPSEEAGLYAALALTGRVVFFATWSIVTAMFPIVAQRYSRGQRHRHLLLLSLAIVLAGSLAIVTLTYSFPEAIVQVLFGPAYLPIAPLLWLYALATTAYALANVVINYRLSIGSADAAYLAIGVGALQVLLLWIFHESLHQVVSIQLGLMICFFVVLLAWDSLHALKQVPMRRIGTPLALDETRAV